YAIGNSGRFGHDNATWSPARIPAAWSPAASWSAFAFSVAYVICSVPNAIATRSGISRAGCSSTDARFRVATAVSFSQETRRSEDQEIKKSRGSPADSKSQESLLNSWPPDLV